RPWKLSATLFSACGLLALVIAAVGIFSTVTYSVAQRTHEFGVRAALGARAADLLRQAVGESLRIVVVGVMIGTTLAIFGGHLVSTLLFGVGPSDPRALIGAATSMLITATIAALAPAWSATRTDPAAMLRTE